MSSSSNFSTYSAVNGTTSLDDDEAAPPIVVRAFIFSGGMIAALVLVGLFVYCVIYRCHR